jgi:2-hydroxychromene-2-carboxylate isomerase
MWRFTGSENRQRFPLKIELVPVFLGGIFKATSDSALPRDSLEFKYMACNLTRHARDVGIPFALPVSFPVNSARSLRGVFYAEREKNYEVVERFVEGSSTRTGEEPRDFERVRAS